MKSTKKNVNRRFGAFFPHPSCCWVFTFWRSAPEWGIWLLQGQVLHMFQVTEISVMSQVASFSILIKN